MAEMDDDELLDALGVEITPLKGSSRTPREERIIAGFEDIVRFRQTHGRAPLHGEGRDIFERLYAVRLDQLRLLPEAHLLLAGLDSAGLLPGAAAAQAQCNADADGLDEDALLAELGMGAAANGETADFADITVLRHVRATADKRAAEEIADRTPCADFEAFQPLFESPFHMTRPYAASLVDGMKVIAKESRTLPEAEFFSTPDALDVVAPVT